MKKVIISAALGLLIPLMSIGQSTLGPGVTGSTLNTPGMPHNFSGQSWNTYNATTMQGQQICQPCHTPHNADITVTEAPLWNHAFSTGTTYQMYTGYEFGAGPAYQGISYGVTAPDGTSKLCLACHDGSVALGSYGGQVGTTFLTGGALFGTDLRNDHPISFPYDSAVAGGVHATNYTYSLYTGASSGRTVGALLENGKVQCISCHSPHANSRGYQLKMDNRNSALCLACHKK